MTTTRALCDMLSDQGPTPPTLQLPLRQHFLTTLCHLLPTTPLSLLLLILLVCDLSLLVMSCQVSEICLSSTIRRLLLPLWSLISSRISSSRDLPPLPSLALLASLCRISSAGPMDLSESSLFLRFPRWLSRIYFLTMASATAAGAQEPAVWPAAISWIECRTRHGIATRTT